MDSDKRDRKEERYKDRFSAKRWDWSGRLTLPSGCTRDDALRFLKHWLDDLKKEEGSEHFRWVRVLARDIRYMGTPMDDDHFEVLIGGLVSRTRRWETQWIELTGGRALLQHFDKEDEMDSFNDLLESMNEDGEIDLKHGH